ncbi:MAG: hypothetical protein EHM70_23500 [Chloroflexota bacterium]|nr:MAG: hypothetical protein EHM70_23500 [Chloroflexota bacterium]
MTWSAYFNIATVALVLGAGLALQAILSAGFETIERLSRRRVSWAARRLRSTMAIHQALNLDIENMTSMDWVKRFWPFLAVPLIGLLVRDAMLVFLAALVALAFVWWTGFSIGQTRRDALDDHAEILILRIRSLLPIEHSVVRSLKKSVGELPPGELALAVRNVVARLEMKESPQQAYTALRRLPGTMVRRLAVLLAGSASTREDVQMDLLGMLEREIHHQRTMRTKLRQALSLIRGTMRALQGGFAAALTGAFIFPISRDYFLMDVSRRVMLIALVMAPLLASLYF